MSRSLKIITALVVAGGLGCAPERPPMLGTSLAPRATGYPQAAHVVPLLTLENPYLVGTAGLIGATATLSEREAAGRQLVNLANQVASDAWRQAQIPTFEQQLGVRAVGDPRLEPWLDGLQQQRLDQIYQAMSQVGGDTILEHCDRVTRAALRPPTEQKLAQNVLSVWAHVPRSAEPSKAAWGMPDAGPSIAGTPVTAAPGQAPTVTTYGGGNAGSWAQRRPADSPIVEPPRVEGGTILGATDVVDRLAPYFLECYRRAYDEYGRFGAWIILTADVSSNGRVDDVTGSGDESVPLSMMECLYGVMRQAQFAPPSGGEARVSIPLSFTPKDSKGR
ncbi:MAG: hypothetical protein KC731_26385 [Myxococcales bacterium]|nr:hypothetical protein [Myxococcales bacterium]